MNHVAISGRLVHDPSLKYSQNGKALVRFTIANNRDKDNPSFIEVKAFGTLAENISKYFVKGRMILIEGRLVQDKWQTKEGANRSKVTVYASRFDFMDSKPETKPEDNTGDERPF